MKKERFYDEQEDKDKKRGLLIALFINASLLALACFPLMGAMMNMEEDAPTTVEMQYVELVSPPKVKEAETKFTEHKANNNAASESPKAEEPKPNPKPEPQPKPTPAPQPKSVETVEDNETPTVKQSPTPSNTTSTKTSPVKGKKTPKVTNNSKKGSTNAKKTTNSTSGTKNGKGKGDEPNADDLGEGVFGRTVKYRPNIKGLTKKKGKISFKVAVNQEGKVLVARHIKDKKYSTITDPKLIANAMRAVKLYKFDRDYTAPNKQWGRLTFVFDIH